MATESLFGASPTIGFADNAEDVYSMATRITFAVAGTITGIRRWGTTNAPAGTPQGTIYDTSGTQLLTPVNFPAHTPAAWNTISGLSFAVTAGQTLDVTAGPLSRYAGESGVFASPLVVGNLTGTAGRFIASGTLAATTTGSTAWYGVDVLFEAAGGQSAAVGTAAETDSAIALARSKLRAVGLALSTEVALALQATKVRALGVAAETGAAVALSRRKARTLGLVGETDVARVIASSSSVLVRAGSTATVAAGRASAASVSAGRSSSATVVGG